MPDFEYSIVGDIVFMSSTRSFGRADVSNWTLSPRSKVVDPVAAEGWDWRHIVIFYIIDYIVGGIPITSHIHEFSSESGNSGRNRFYV